MEGSVQLESRGRDTELMVELDEGRLAIAAEGPGIHVVDVSAEAALEALRDLVALGPDEHRARRVLIFVERAGAAGALDGRQAQEAEELREGRPAEQGVGDHWAPPSCLACSAGSACLAMKAIRLS